MVDETLDLTVLQSLFGDDRQLQVAILKEFDRSAEPYLRELDAAVAHGNRGSVASLAHKLKSSARTVGALRLGDLCEQLEVKACDDDWGQIRLYRDSLRAAIAEVVQAIGRRTGR